MIGALLSHHLGVHHYPWMTPIQNVNAMRPWGHAGMRKPTTTVVHLNGIELRKSDYTDETWVRVVAGNCFIAAGHDVKGGMELFKQVLPNHNLSRGGLNRFVKKWGENILRGRGPNAASRSGRPSKIDSDTAIWLAQTISDGYEDEHGNHRHYTTWAAVWQNCPEAIGVLFGLDVCPKTVKRHMEKHFPNLGKFTVDYKCVLTSKHKRDRVTAAKELLEKVEADPLLLRSTFWLDAATVYVQLKTGTIITDKTQLEQFDTQEHRAVPTTSSETIKIKYFAMVNAVAGPVGIVIATGSTGIKEKNQREGREPYMVSATGGSCH